jgi:hypothetical protein
MNEKKRERKKPEVAWCCIAHLGLVFMNIFSRRDSKRIADKLSMALTKKIQT